MYFRTRSRSASDRSQSVPINLAKLGAAATVAARFSRVLVRHLARLPLADFVSACEFGTWDCDALDLG